MRLEFGDCVFDSATHELTRGDGAVALSPKAFELLATLLAHRPRALSKEELHEAVWADTFVSDSSLARLVSELRAALEETKETRWIRTVHGFGYAFKGDVTELPAIGTEPAATCWLAYERRVIPLRDGENLIGRAADSAVILETSRVSRRHSRILITGGRATLEDLGSKNGTYLEGNRIHEPATLTDGDQITVGSKLLTFRTGGKGLSTETELSFTIREP